MQPVFHLVPQRGLAQRALHRFIEVPARQLAVHPQARCHVVVNRHRGERRRPLEHHAHAPAHRHGIDRAVVNVHPPTHPLPPPPPPPPHPVHPLAAPHHRP